jgi:RNA polymerase primary sigma factor
MKAKKNEKKIKKLSKPSVNKATVKKESKVKPSLKTVKTARVKEQPVKKPAALKMKKTEVKKKPTKAAPAKKAVKNPVKKTIKKALVSKAKNIKKIPAKKTDKKPAVPHKTAKTEKPSAKKTVGIVIAKGSVKKPVITSAKKTVKGAEDVKKTEVHAKTAVKSVKETSKKIPVELPKTVPGLPGKRKVGRPRKLGSDGEGAAPRPKRETSPDDTSSLSKNDTMKVYMQDIGQISLVTKEEEVELAAKIHGTDMKLKEEARATLIKANLRLVVKIAHDFKGLGLPLLDLISEGNIGLMRAVEKFDPAKGAKFSSYAAWWIKQSMRRALANQSKTIRIPVQSAGKINKIKSARLKLTEKLGREPTDAEIAGFLEFSERTVAGLRLADLRTFSLHDPIQQGEDGEFQDIIPDRHASIPDRILGDLESVSRLTNLMESLDEREKMILKMRFGLDGNKPRTLEEVSQEIGRTRERVRQIQNQALTKLKSLLIDESGFVYE